MEFQDIEGFRKKDRVEKLWKRSVDLTESVDKSINKEREETKTEETDYQNLKRKLDFSKIKKTSKKLTPKVSITLKEPVQKEVVEKGKKRAREEEVEETTNQRKSSEIYYGNHQGTREEFRNRN